MATTRSLARMSAILVLAVLVGFLAAPIGACAKGRLEEFLPRLQPAEIDPAADRFGPIEGDPPVAPLLAQGKLVGYAFLNADVVDSTGYSGKPINIVIGLDRDGRITGAKLVEHHEPIFLIGIPQGKIEHFIAGYVGRRVLAPEAVSESPVDIVSGATVTTMVIGDSIMRASIRIARLHGLGGATAAAAGGAAPERQIDPTKSAVVKSFQALLGDGSVRRLLLTNREINDIFRRTGNAAAAEHPETGPPDAPYIDLYVALASVPTIGRSLLGDAEYATLEKRLKPGDQAILVAGDGPYSFRGSGYVRGGIFDRIEIIQGESSIRFRDRDYKRIGSLAPEDAPDFVEIGLFVTPDGVQLDPTRPWRLQLLVQRRTGAMDKAFVTVATSYATPDKYLTAAPAAAAPAAAAPAAPAAAAAAASPAAAESGPPLWQRVWRGKLADIAVLLLAIGLLTGIFFFQDVLVRRPVLYERLRLSYLAFTLLWLGWYEHAQLSIVNVFTFANAVRGSFRWDYFLMDPMVFILWCSVAAALLFWGRGAFCGWLCPFGALQEWMNRIARWCRIPQLTLPFGLHQRLWPIKYIVFLGLFGVSLGSLALAEELSEIEPFKTAIILHFARDWWFVLLALALLAPGLFVERFYCRYLCPLGGALAIPGRMRMFDWLRRYRECGSPCQRCAGECPVQAIHPEGQINPNECIQCLNCQVLYHHDQKCPVMIQRRIKRERRLALSSESMRPGAPPGKASLETVDSGERSLLAVHHRPAGHRSEGAQDVGS
jgi:NosR/NirI family transcriptional regulator, nitrous oxide reductase regulator